MTFRDGQYDVFNMFDKQWALAAAGTVEDFDGCTIGWGSLGSLWGLRSDGRLIVTIYVNPLRYTSEYLLKNDCFTVSFFEEKYRRELGVDVSDYSLWGGSAGARMAAWLGSRGTGAFGEKSCPRPVAVVMQYTGLSEVTGDEPPTYSCVGTDDGIASYRTMQERTRRIRAQGTDAEIEVFDGLPHGFGLGEGTVAEGWLDRAAAFWERRMR